MPGSLLESIGLYWIGLREQLQDNLIFHGEKEHVKTMVSGEDFPFNQSTVSVGTQGSVSQQLPICHCLPLSNVPDFGSIILKNRIYKNETSVFVFNCEKQVLNQKWMRLKNVKHPLYDSHGKRHRYVHFVVIWFDDLPVNNGDFHSNLLVITKWSPLFLWMFPSDPHFPIISLAKSC